MVEIWRVNVCESVNVLNTKAIICTIPFLKWFYKGVLKGIIFWNVYKVLLQSHSKRTPLGTSVQKQAASSGINSVVTG